MLELQLRPFVVAVAASPAAESLARNFNIFLPLRLVRLFFKYLSLSNIGNRSLDQFIISSAGFAVSLARN
jgi:hypothetical protein